MDSACLHRRPSKITHFSNGSHHLDDISEAKESKHASTSKSDGAYNDTHGGDSNEAHPLLRGGQPPYPNVFSNGEMEVLTAVYDAIYPSRPSTASSYGDIDKQHVTSCNSSTSADIKLPENVAGMLTKVLPPSQLKMIRFILFLLSTRLGTLILCGKSSFVSEFPFLQAFPGLPLWKREQILRGWTTSRLTIFQLIFKVLKGSIVWSYFARADSSGHNPIWKELGYYIPERDRSANRRKRPLDGKVIDVKEEAALCDRLRDFGFWAQEREGGTQGSRDADVKCDVVVVGSGSGGGVVAGVLAQAGFKVLILEKGDYFARDDYSHIEAPSAMAMFEGPNVLLTQDGSVVVKAGSTVGGGSAVNWSASLRTPDHVVREWADVEKLEWFMEEKYQKALDKVCERMNVNVGFKKESLQNRTLRKGCMQLGYHVEDVACNAVGEHYCGWCELGCSSGAKQSTAETWLVDAVRNGSLILTGCKAERVLHCGGGKKKNRRATGVLAHILHGKLYVHARAVVAAAGALQTPLLLRRSGLWNRQIGRNLHLHPTIMAWGYVPEGGTDGEVQLDRSFEGGIITACSRELGNKNSGYGVLLQCPSIHPGAFAFLSPWVSRAQFKCSMQRYARTCVIFTLARDQTCGTVSEDREGSVVIDYKLLPGDAALMLEGVQAAVRILAASPGVAEVGTMSCDADSTDPVHVNDYLARLRARGFRGLDYGIQSAHQMGTCRMGMDPGTSAVDPRCESWEVEGLFVGDTSVFPTALGVNPMVTVQAISFCTAHHIIDFLKLST